METKIKYRGPRKAWNEKNRERKKEIILSKACWVSELICGLQVTTYRCTTHNGEGRYCEALSL